MFKRECDYTGFYLGTSDTNKGLIYKLTKYRSPYEPSLYLYRLSVVYSPDGDFENVFKNITVGSFEVKRCIDKGFFKPYKLTKAQKVLYAW